MNFAAAGTKKTLLLAEETRNGPLAELLAACGVPFTSVDAEGLFASEELRSGVQRALLISEDSLARMYAVALEQHRSLRSVLQAGKPLLIFPFRGTAEGVRAFESLTAARVDVSLPAQGTEYVVAKSVDLCGPFAGLQFGPVNGVLDRGIVLRDCESPVDYLVTVEGKGLFTRIRLPEGDVFVASCAAVFDPRAETVTNLRAATCFSTLVPLLLFVHHSGAAIWRTPRSFANVMIDDPNLRPSYGFVSMKALADCVDRLEAAATIGFIPWNYRRTSITTVELLRSKWPRLSVCMHGCDHTRSEFSTRTVSESLQLIGLGMERMDRLAARTGLKYDRVMIFPQGVFSATAMSALRQSSLLAAVNTELVEHASDRGVPAGELLKPAITCYSGFPLFLRRKADEPVANFALDLLLGKPCLIVTHHDFFRGGMEAYSSLIQSLNALDRSLAWTNLETIVARTCSIRTHPSSSVDVRLLSCRTALDADLPTGTVCFQKSEPLADRQIQVFFDERQVKSRRDKDDVVFLSEISKGDRHIVRVEVAPKDTVLAASHSFKQRLKVSARRHLSEVRDNYVARSPTLAAALASVQHLVRRLPKAPA